MLVPSLPQAMSKFHSGCKRKLEEGGCATADVPLTLLEYQEGARGTAFYPGKGANFVYPALGLAGESGEVANKVKKVLRDEDGKLSEQSRVALIDELGDVLWYLSAMADELGETLEAVAARNLAKLKARQEKGSLQGSGDVR